MSTPQNPLAAARSLPVRPNIEYLRHEAKRRLAMQRPAQPGLKLSAVQFEIAREYGFTSWRALKTALEQPSPLVLEAAGDWIGRLPQGTRIALHVDPDRVTMDSPDYGSYGFVVHDFGAGGGQLRFTLPRINVGFDADWDERAGGWRGLWRQDGLDSALVLTRGVFPPAAVVDGLDGIWEGLLGANAVRMIFTVTTNAHGTHAMCDSPDRSGSNLPVEAVERVGNQIAFRLKTARFEGALTPENDRIDGTFFRGELVRPLSLGRRVPGAAPLAAPGVHLSRAELETRVGRYRFEGGEAEVEVTVDGDQLSARFSDGRVVGLVPVAADTFRLKQGVGQVVFDGAKATLWSYSRRNEAQRVA